MASPISVVEAWPPRSRVRGPSASTVSIVGRLEPGYASPDLQTEAL